MTSQPKTLTPRTIGETENALRATLAKSLAGTGLDYHSWVAVKLVSEANSPITEESAVDVMINGLKIGEAEATAILDHLTDEGILGKSDGNLVTTSEGAGFYDLVIGRTGQNAQTMWAGLATEDLATAHSVLTTIRDRANEILTAP